MSDPRYAYVVPAGTAFSDSPGGTTRGVLTADANVAADGVRKRKGSTLLVTMELADQRFDGWIPDEALHSTILEGDDEPTRWQTLASELAALDAAAGGGVVGAEPKTKTFAMSPDDVAHLLASAREKGMDVETTGANAYSIDTHTAGVKLAASYDPDKQIATITIAASDWYVSNAAVWEKLAPMMPAHVAAATPAPATPATTSTTPEAAPASTDAEAHVTYLEQAERQISAAWEKAKDLPDEARKRVRDAGVKAVRTARALARDVENGTRTMATELHDRALAVWNKLKDDAKAIAPWYIAAGIGTWVLIGGVLYFVFKDEARRDTAKHAMAAAL